MRLKITGYIDVDEIEAQHLDLQHPTGLTAEGYDGLIMGDVDGVYPLSLSSLDDLDTSLEN